MNVTGTGADANASNLINRMIDLRDHLYKLVALCEFIVGPVASVQDKTKHAEPCGTLDKLSDLVEDCTKHTSTLGGQLSKINSQVGGD